MCLELYDSFRFQSFLISIANHPKPRSKHNSFVTSLLTYLLSRLKSKLSLALKARSRKMKDPHPGDYNQPSEQVFRNVERQSPTSLSRDDPHTYNQDERGRSRIAHSQEGKPRRRGTASRSRSRSSGSASKRLANSRPRSKMRKESRGKPDYRYAYY